MEKVGAVVLAAGGSTRLGRPKQLLPFRGETLLYRTVDGAVAAGCAPVVAVVGAESESIELDLGGTTAQLVRNLEWPKGIGTSIRAGIREALKLDSEMSAIVLLVCDQPFVSAQTITALRAKHTETRRPIVASRYAGTLGVPALFDRSCFDALLALPDRCGAKSLILSRRDQVAEYAFPEGVIDIDTATDYEKLGGGGG